MPLLARKPQMLAMQNRKVLQQNLPKIRMAETRIVVLLAPELPNSSTTTHNKQS
jgi:hypothetical protein